MPLPALVKTLIEKKVDEFCKKRVPPQHIIAEVVEIENKITSSLNSLIKRVE